MTSERIDEPTPAGGEYAVLVYVDLETLQEVDKRVATGVLISEYNDGDLLIMETVAPYQYTG